MSILNAVDIMQTRSPETALRDQADSVRAGSRNKKSRLSPALDTPKGMAVWLSQFTRALAAGVAVRLVEFRFLSSVMYSFGISSEDDGICIPMCVAMSPTKALQL